jgi:hypothetical protein
MNLDFNVNCIRADPQAGICEVSGSSFPPTAQPYAVLRQTFNPFVTPGPPPVLNLDTGFPPIEISISTPLALTTFSSSSNLTVNPTNWTVTTAGDYSIDVSVLIFSIVPTGTAGQPQYISFNIPVTVNGPIVDTIVTDVESILAPVIMSTELSFIPRHGMTVLSLNAGNVIGLTIATTLPLSPPNQGVTKYVVKIQRLGP